MSEKRKSGLSYFIRRFKTHRLAMTGLAIILLEIVVVYGLPVIVSMEPNTSDLTAILQAPNQKHILGTDSLGRDVFARLLSGGQVSLFIGFLATIVGLIVGVPLGVLAGYFRGKIELVIMRTADIFMSFPYIILVLVIVSIIGPSVWSVAVIMGIMSWTRFARLIHGNVIAEREKQYVESAVSIGSSTADIIFKSILPNSITPVLIALTFNTSSAILAESGLSFLGMGVQPPQASWGNLLFNAQSITIITQNHWLWVPPGLLLIITTISINFIGDGLRDAFDPKTIL
ncbi:MAG: ABC transporter permease [Spirochaetaceae bacterium]|jgi:peptide/nickel transport system permease protein|nr:ABC transporter permease [Spirochaetaceae bacterium]